MTIRIDQINDTKGKTDFLALKQAISAQDSLYIPSNEGFPTEGISFIAYENIQPVAGCCARLQTGNPAIGTIGSFHALNKPDAVQAMLEAAARWLKDQGAQRVLAPMDGDTWHPYRFNTGPFDQPPFIKEPWNPPYYPALLEAAGFSTIETYESHLADSAQAADNQKKFHVRCVRNGYTFKAITARNYAQLLPLIYELSCQIFSSNLFYTPIDQTEFIRLYMPAKALLKPGLSWFSYDPEGQPAGYIFTFPDYADALRAMEGKNSLPAKVRFLINKRKATRSCIKTLGILPADRGSGLAAALTHLSYRHSAKLGYADTLMCLMHSSNDSRRFGGRADQPFRSYALYELLK